MEKIPHFWQSIPGFFLDWDTQFYKFIIDQFQGAAHFVEIGSYKGRSSSYMAVEIINSGKNIKFDCVDTWMGSEEHQKGQYSEDQDVVNDRLFDVFNNNMKPVEGHYNTIRLDSVSAASNYPDRSLDFVFIDAAHDYESVKQDIIAWLPKVKIGGIISGHDYHHPPVVQAVSEMLPDASGVYACWMTTVKST